jgi:hypothetical protein
MVVVVMATVVVVVVVVVVMVVAGILAFGQGHDDVLLSKRGARERRWVVVWCGEPVDVSRAGGWSRGVRRIAREPVRALRGEDMISLGGG